MTLGMLRSQLLALQAQMEALMVTISMLEEASRLAQSEVEEEEVEEVRLPPVFGRNSRPAE